MLAGAIAYLILGIICLKYKKEKSIKLARNILMILVILNIFVISAALYYPQGTVVSIASKSVYGQEWGQKRLGGAAAKG